MSYLHASVVNDFTADLREKRAGGRYKIHWQVMFHEETDMREVC